VVIGLMYFSGIFIARIYILFFDLDISITKCAVTFGWIVSIDSYARPSMDFCYGETLPLSSLTTYGISLQSSRYNTTLSMSRKSLDLRANGIRTSEWMYPEVSSSSRYFFCSSDPFICVSSSSRLLLLESLENKTFFLSEGI
jgi:hypothetical protein